MKILVVGAGGREHAIIKKLKENPEVTEIFACPGNGGIAKDAECVNISATDLDGITDFAVKMNIDFCVVAPDDPLVLGLVDILESKGIPCFGPSKKAAIIEGSKVFSKNLMKKYGIPTAGYEVFSDPEEALSYIKEKLGIPVLRYAGNPNITISRVAVLGGAGSEFAALAKAKGADLYLTGDLKYHEAQDASRLGLLIADGGHFYTERVIVPALAKRLRTYAAEHGWEIKVIEDSRAEDIFREV